jgi:hypothetical protein
VSPFGARIINPTPKIKSACLVETVVLYTTMLHEERASASDSSTSFAVDVVRRLGSRLDAIQDKEDWAAGDESKALDQQDDAEASSSAVIDVTNITSVHSTKQLQTALQRSGVEQTIELARVTYAAYGVVLDQLLKDAERVNDQAWYWTQVEEDPSKTVIYLVQSEHLEARRRRYLCADSSYSFSRSTGQPDNNSSSYAFDYHQSDD